MGLSTIWQMSPPVWGEFNTFPKIATRVPLDPRGAFTAFVQRFQGKQERLLGGLTATSVPPASFLAMSFIYDAFETGLSTN